MIARSEKNVCVNTQSKTLEPMAFKISSAIGRLLKEKSLILNIGRTTAILRQCPRELTNSLHSKHTEGKK